MKKLSLQEKKSGQKNYLTFCTMNGLSMAFLAETTLMLYALKIGIPDYIVAVVASFIFLGTFFVIAGRHLIKFIGTTKTASLSWYMRNLFGVFTALAPVLMAYYSPFLGVVILLIGAFGFYSFRGIGMAALLPIVGEITAEDNEQGKFNSKTAFRFNIGYFVAMTLLIIVFKLSDNVSTFQFVIVVGFLVGCYSAYKVSRIPESGEAKESASFTFFESLKFCLRNKQVRKLLIAQTIGYSCMALVIPYSVLALKEVYEVRDYSALFFVLIQGGGGILMAVYGAKFAGHNSFRKLFVYSYIFMLVVIIMWVLMPVNFTFYYTFVIFALAGVGQIGIFISLSHYFLAVIPPERLVGSNVVISVVSSTFAGLTGAIAGVVVLESLEYYKLPEVMVYKIFFACILCVLLAGLFAILMVEKSNGKAIG